MAAIGSASLTLEIDDDEVTAEVTRAIIVAGASDADTVTFAEAATGGGRQYTLALTLLQDAAATALWNKIWTAAGTTVDVLVRPYGNASASVAQPHFSGTVTITEPDGDLIGGEADASRSRRYVTEVEWPFTAKPTRVTT